MSVNAFIRLYMYVLHSYIHMSYTPHETGWHQNPRRRPTMNEVVERLETIESKYNPIWLARERPKSASSNLPSFILRQLKQGVKPKPKDHSNATIVFADIVGFTTLSSYVSECLE